MIEESRLLWMLDFLAEKAKEFVIVSNDIIDGEQALQSRNDVNPSEWQICSTLSAFINFIAESERHRYGHFACDIEKKNNENKFHVAKNTLSRMKLFWDVENFEDASEEELNQRDDLVKQFLENDRKIRKHLTTQPNFYDTHDRFRHQEQILRDWSTTLMAYGEKEIKIFKEWEKIMQARKQSQVDAKLKNQ